MLPSLSLQFHQLMATESDSIKASLYFSLVAGLSTAIGAAVVFCIPAKNGQKQVPSQAMAFSLALAGSVMLTISVVSIIPECLSDYAIKIGGDDDNEYHLLPLGWTFIMRIVSFIAGTGLYFCLSRCLTEPDQLLEDNIKTLVGFKKYVPNEADLEMEGLSLLTETIRNRNTSSPLSRNNSSCSISTQMNSYENESIESSIKSSATLNTIDPISWTMGRDLKNLQNQKAWRVAMMLFISLLVHNFPEGLAVAASTIKNQNLGITVTIGIIIHNIPEGIAIAIPCLAARPDKPWLSFILATVSGLAEPAGAFVAITFLRGMENDSESIFCLPNILAFVAGTMVTVSVVELLPHAIRHTANTMSYFWYGTVIGIVIMLTTERYLES